MTSLEEYTTTVEEMMEYLHNYYSGSKDFDFSEKYRDTIRKVGHIYDTLENLP